MKKFAAQAAKHRSNWPGADLVFVFPQPVSAVPRRVRDAIIEADARYEEALF